MGHGYNLAFDGCARFLALGVDRASLEHGHGVANWSQRISQLVTEPRKELVLLTVELSERVGARRLFGGPLPLGDVAARDPCAHSAPYRRGG